MLGITAFVVGDVIYLNQVATSTYVQGTCSTRRGRSGCGSSGSRRGRETRSPSSPEDDPPGSRRASRSFPSPSGAFGAGPRHLPRAPHVAVTSLLAISALVLVIVRMALTLREVLDVERDNFQHGPGRRADGPEQPAGFFELGAEARVPRRRKTAPRHPARRPRRVQGDQRLARPRCAATSC